MKERIKQHKKKTGQQKNPSLLMAGPPTWRGVEVGEEGQAALCLLLNYCFARRVLIPASEFCGVFCFVCY